MADFVAVLRKTIEGLNDTSPGMREKVYRKARDTVAAKLAAIDPPPSRIVIERQTRALEDAIKAVEAGFAAEPGADDFESVLAGMEGAAPAAPEARPPAAVAPPAEPPQQPLPVRAAPAPASKAVIADEAAAAPAEGGEDELVPAAIHRPEPKLPPAAAAARAERRRLPVGLIAALVAVIVVAAGGYGLWINRADLASLAGLGDAPVAESEPALPSATTGEPGAAVAEAETPDSQLASAEAGEPRGTETAAGGQAEPAEDMPKFTHRLLADGREVDEGPADGGRSVGEGTSTASATQLADNSAAAQAPASAPPASGQTPAAEQGVPVGQRAILYEERTNVAEGTADNGTIVWSLVNESPGGDLPPEPAIRAEVNIPSKNVQLKMTIRRNADQTLPASHIVEMIFLGNYEGGGIDNVFRVALKGSEAAPGNPLIGIPARITDGYFLVALSSSQAERDTNLELLLRQSWIDILLGYKSGRRALVTLEKGVPGDRVFQEAIQAWRNASSG